MEVVLSVFNDPRVILPGKHTYTGPPGLGAYYVNQDETVGGLLFCCPGDGVVHSISFMVGKEKPSWSWNGDKEKPTTKPSILCAPEKGGCGWHGWLTEGRFHL